MLLRVREYCRQFPVTAVCLALCVGLYVAAHVCGWHWGVEYNDAIWRLGSVARLHLVAPQKFDLPAGPSGLFDLWSWELWRIWVTNFHHAGGLIHLAMNMSALIMFGAMLESRLGTWRYVLLIVFGAGASIIPECLLGNGAAGFSGVLCAMFGLLLVVREQDEQIALAIPPSAVRFTFVFLFGCILVTYLEWVAIANAAHFSGLAWGWLAGQAYYGRWSTRFPLWTIFVCAQVLLIPALYLCAVPFWNGTYYWYMAKTHEKDPQRRLELYAKAIEIDPGLEDGWVYLAAAYSEQGRSQDAWTTAVRGLNHNRSSSQTQKLVVQLWRMFRTRPERTEALATLQKIFGDDAPNWYKPLGMLGTGQQVQLDPGRPPTVPLVDWRAGLPAVMEKRRPLIHIRETPPAVRNLDAPAVNPDDEESAAVGTTL